MSVPKRLCLLVFGLSGAFCLVALMLPWFGPWTQWAGAMLSERWYYLAVEATWALTVLGMLVCLARAILTPRRRRVVVVDRVGSDEITVACAAISSQATHVVERGGAYVAERVRVHAGKSRVRVSVRVRPTRPVDVTVEGPHLHDELVAGLSTLVGDAISGVAVEFVEMAQSPLSHGQEYGYDHGPEAEGARLGAGELAGLSAGGEDAVGDAPAEVTVPVATAGERAGITIPAPTGGSRGEITVPMAHGIATGTSGEEGE